MENVLLLRCTKCSGHLGSWRPEVDHYKCGTCSAMYFKQDGVLDFIGDCASFDEDLSAGQMSSFAKPTVEESDWKNVSIRLQTLFAENHPEQGEATATRTADGDSGIMLDIGCGYGGLAASAARNFRMVVGVDADMEQLRSASSVLGERFPANLVLIRAWAENLPFMPGQFNAVTCVQALEHVLNPEAAIAQIRLVLAQHARLYLSVPNRFTLRREPHTNLRLIGYLPRSWALRYASLMGRQKELQSVHFFSPKTLSEMLGSAFGPSFKFIRSGCHRSILGILAKRAWNTPLLSTLSGQLVGDLEVIGWTTPTAR